VSRATQQMRDFAKRVNSCENGGGRIFATKSKAVFPVSDKLRLPLTTLLGTGGFKGLLARALVLAGEEAPWLRSIRVKEDGTLEEGGECDLQITAPQQVEGRLVLLAHLLGLLVTFIGPVFTSHLVTEIWPKVLLSDLNLGNREN
jgi:hypothetical protein